MYLPICFYVVCTYYISLQNLDSALDVVFDLTMRWDSVWEGLVNEGIVKALCYTTRELVLLLSEEERRAGPESNVSVHSLLNPIYAF